MTKAICGIFCLLTWSLSSAAESSWPLWEAFKTHNLSEDGRVIDWSQSITTSEGQAYALFFALVANDQATFRKLLSWTQDNLVVKEKNQNLPAWKWGQNKHGQWEILDHNNATDADLWMAYTLLEAGRIWKNPAYKTFGENLLWLTAVYSLKNIRGLGLMLLPAQNHFERKDADNILYWKLNPSYLPPFLLQRFTSIAPLWEPVQRNSLQFLVDSAPYGLSPDWVLYRPQKGYYHTENTEHTGSYDAVRNYLWAGILATSETKNRLLKHYSPLLEIIRKHHGMPEKLSISGEILNARKPASSACALLPFLASSGENDLLLENIQKCLDGLTNPKNYYTQVLGLFALGWLQGRYSFNQDGTLLLSRKTK
ncbi:cellulose synthase complex periplasmic endoglucanase BcsZ [Thiomicrorhabdus sp.]|uniref:cellulose synthase complex periplasmic endoglucanase BcsZ n=1 Tax=Thiomicrorhabdus sp. TaxID=2039724 RepID=UPI0029C8B550|nr:cellulose synthase complex periplasmic endoglucanase BcsZ [Thiomicrorhabdus sp.]